MRGFRCGKCNAPAHSYSLYNNNPTRNAFGKLYDNGTPPGVNRSTARDLLEVAKMINGTEQGMVNSRFFWVEVFNECC